LSKNLKTNATGEAGNTEDTLRTGILEYVNQLKEQAQNANTEAKAIAEGHIAKFQDMIERLNGIAVDKKSVAEDALRKLGQQFSEKADALMSIGEEQGASIHFSAYANRFSGWASQLWSGINDGGLIDAAGVAATTVQIDDMVDGLQNSTETESSSLIQQKIDTLRKMQAKVWNVIGEWAE